MPDVFFDPKGLIREAFVIEGIAAPECRSIFLDWALGVPVGYDVHEEVRKILDHYGPKVAASHPMLITLQAALETPAVPRRRGGRARRVPQA